MTDTELVARLERLERDNRRLKRVALGALVLVAACVGLGAAYAKPAIPQKIVAHEFDVVDGSGKVRIRLSAQKEGVAGLVLLNTKGTAAVSMSWSKFLGPDIELGFHRLRLRPSGVPSGMEVADIDIGDQPSGGPAITIDRPGALRPSVALGVTPLGQPGVALLDSTSHSRAEFTLSTSGEPNIKLSDPAGYSLDLGSTSTVIPATGQTRQTSAASIVMFGNDKKHHVIWEAPQQ